MPGVSVVGALLVPGHGVRRISRRSRSARPHSELFESRFLGCLFVGPVYGLNERDLGLRKNISANSHRAALLNRYNYVHD
jgi:hypothetical protein